MTEENIEEENISSESSNDITKDFDPVRPADTANPILNAKIWRAKQELKKLEKFGERPAPHVPREGMQYPVTDLKYYMDGYLRDNLNEVPKFLKKGWDCVIIVAGNAKVRIGKSTLAMQMAYYLAWLLNEDRKKKKEIPSDAQVPFDNSNIAFSPDEVMKLATGKPKHSVLVYDEGRAGLDAAGAMQNINKTMTDFFQECGQYGHIIIIVLPDFFKLSEMIAIPRSLFLINVYHDRNYNRGYFSFFNEHRKELLYVLGRKKLGSWSKYAAVPHNFPGRFTPYFPINKEMYDKQKDSAMKKKKRSQLEQRWHIERDAALYFIKKITKMPAKDITKELNVLLDHQVSEFSVTRAIQRIRRKQNEDISDEDNE